MGVRGVGGGLVASKGGGGMSESGAGGSPQALGLNGSPQSALHAAPVNGEKSDELKLHLESATDTSLSCPVHQLASSHPKLIIIISDVGDRLSEA